MSLCKKTSFLKKEKPRKPLYSCSRIRVGEGLPKDEKTQNFTKSVTNMSKKTSRKSNANTMKKHRQIYQKLAYFVIEIMMNFVAFSRCEPWAACSTSKIDFLCQKLDFGTHVGTPGRPNGDQNRRPWLPKLARDPPKMALESHFGHHPEFSLFLGAPGLNFGSPGGAPGSFSGLFAIVFYTLRT